MYRQNTKAHKRKFKMMRWASKSMQDNSLSVICGKFTALVGHTEKKKPKVRRLYNVELDNVTVFGNIK